MGFVVAGEGAGAGEAAGGDEFEPAIGRGSNVIAVEIN